MVEAVAGGPEVGLEEVGLAWQEDVGPGHGGLGGQGEGCREEEERGEHPTTHSKEGGGGLIYQPSWTMDSSRHYLLIGYEHTILLKIDLFPFYI